MGIRSMRKYKKEWYQKHKESIIGERKEYYQKNKQKIKKQIKLYIEKNKDIISIKRKKHYLKHRKKILARGKIYRDKNKEIIKKRRRKYLETPLWIYFRIKNNAIHRKQIFSISKEDFINWYNCQKQECYYCNKSLSEIKKDKSVPFNMKMRLTIDRKDNKKGYIINNIVLACNRCNTIKGNFFTEQQMLKIAKFIKRLR